MWVPFRGRSATEEAKRSLCPWNCSPFRTSFWHIFGSSVVLFSSVFSCARIFCTSGGFGAPRCRKVRFWEVLLMPFGGQGQKVKIDVLCRRQLNLEGLGGSQTRRNLRRCSEGVKSVPLGGTFGDFLEFGGPIGGRRGSIWAKKGIFF